MMEARGVRTLCAIELNSAFCRLSPSARKSACRALSSSETRNMANAVWLANDSTNVHIGVGSRPRNPLARNPSDPIVPLHVVRGTK